MKQFNNLKILAIETSCDDTCVAIIKVSDKKNPRFNILSDIASSQAQIHQKYGGIYPALARREHQKNLPIIFKKIVRGRTSYNFDIIAVTVGPGLEPCLWVGVNFARELAHKLNVPIVPVNHIESHILVNAINNPAPLSKDRRGQQLTISNFPAICLVVSGGHTQLILMRDFGEYKILGETRDDAAGECLDKVARILGLDYPGGPEIAKQASLRRSDLRKCGGRTSASLSKLPRPMMHTKNYDFSFSGLKTAVLYNFKTQPPKIRKNKEYIRKMCSEIQQAIIDVLIKKTIKAAKDYRVKTIVLGGGVSANDELRKQLKKACLKCHFKHLIPPKNLSTDNAVMTAVAGYFRWGQRRTENWKHIKADANLRIDIGNFEF
ncbi:MAG: tRNA (adenosine(37)-N6)-threonylcarbamoyltransferase complex transferase subunit TsaD [Candidatus Nealsonbacteria bacterium]|nr:tRNA (adenosine(37)-N6)-threonylcarbamoyltransferase complex transferase subunit TsaD [Candidatus Nealsonbacteria bacterium]